MEEENCASPEVGRISQLDVQSIPGSSETLQMENIGTSCPSSHFFQQHPGLLMNSDSGEIASCAFSSFLFWKKILHMEEAHKGTLISVPGCSVQV
jgi:hypothetical protein